MPVIQRDPSCLLLLDGVANGGERFVDRQIERPKAQDLDEAALDERSEVGPERACSSEILSGVVLEDDDDARLSRLGPGRDEVPREERLARARRPHEER